MRAPSVGTASLRTRYFESQPGQVTIILDASQTASAKGIPDDVVVERPALRAAVCQSVTSPPQEVFEGARVSQRCEKCRRRQGFPWALGTLPLHIQALASAFFEELHLKNVQAGGKFDGARDLKGPVDEIVVDDDAVIDEDARSVVRS